MARKVAKQKDKRPNIPVLIGAGITEQWYFTHLKDLQNLRLKIRPRFFGKEQIHNLEKNVEQVLATDGEVIVVFDTDVTQWNEIERKRLELFRNKYKKDCRVLLCESMPSIEYWFLLHFVKTNQYFETSRAVIAKLKTFIEHFDKTEHFLHNQKWVKDLSADGRLENALEYAKKNGMRGASYTDVWKVMEKLFANK